jgi:hypothetical protein
LIKKYSANMLGPKDLSISYRKIAWGDIFLSIFMNFLS